MSWLQPTDFERRLVADLRRRWPEVVPLAQLLSLATRIEPLLLRNIRLRFLPGSATEIESLLWFSPLIGARSSDEVILHAGAARLLADELRGDVDRFAQTIDFTRRHCRHWSPEERLEQDLRLDVLLDDQDAVRQGLQDLLKRLHDEADEEQRIRLARWSRRCLTMVSEPQNALAEAQLLGQFAICSLGASSVLAPGSALQPLPEWLADKLPTPFRPARLAVELRYDAAQQRAVLHFFAATDSGPVIDLPTPLPANLHVQGDGSRGTWHIVSLDGRIPLPAATDRVVLTTIDGRRYELRAELPAEPMRQGSPALPPLTLSHLPEDEEEARAIADWLRRSGIAVQLMPEHLLEAKTDETAEHADDSRRLLRLWTPAAHRRCAERRLDEPSPGPRTLFLRVGETSAPPVGYGAEKLLDLPVDWRSREPLAASVCKQLHEWLATEKVSATTPEAEIEPEIESESEADQETTEESSELARLLAELDDLKTPPPRRLEIGDRLAEMGDPRPGVGVREHVLPDVLPDPPAGNQMLTEAKALLSELDDPQTLPPRRLEIGDRLNETGDPRRGVGLDGSGRPEIDWVDIPGGEFIYQEGERRRLESFRMARYPITNLQYQAFIDAGGYAQAKKRFWQKSNTLEQAGDWWQDLDRPHPQASRWSQSNRPRTNVNWYEAVAFCRWLSAQLGHEVRLPTEEEWERAARGREGRDYPWGKEYESGRANISESSWGSNHSYLKQTTAVGAYPQGASCEALLDLSGNVWEWCLNKYEHPERIQADTSGEARVLRGGSWYYSAGYACGSRRDGYDPGGRHDDYGFRVASSVPIA
jgi:formylglycine-generating enzyme required for sulfatase activity